MVVFMSSSTEARGNRCAETFARMLDDEIDMTQGPGACPGAINAAKASLPNDGRMRYANYGKGVLIWGAAATTASKQRAPVLSTRRT